MALAQWHWHNCIGTVAIGTTICLFFSLFLPLYICLLYLPFMSAVQIVSIGGDDDDYAFNLNEDAMMEILNKAPHNIKVSIHS